MIMCSREIKNFSEDIANDLQGSEIKTLVIYAGNKPNTMSPSEFEQCKIELAKLVPDIKVIYQRVTE
jgi:hypothetical protein